MPKGALWKIVALLLRTTERNWLWRPQLEELLLALEELETIVTKGDHQQSDLGTFKVTPYSNTEVVFQFAERERMAVERTKEILKKAEPIKSALEALAISREKLQEDTFNYRERSESSKMRLSKLQSDISIATNSMNFKEATRLWEGVQNLMDALTSGAERMRHQGSELERVEKEIAKKEAMLALVYEEVAESERESAVARCQRLRLVARAVKWEKKAAADRDDFGEAAFLLEKAKVLDKEADELQSRYGLKGKQFE